MRSTRSVDAMNQRNVGSLLHTPRPRERDHTDQPSPVPSTNHGDGPCSGQVPDKPIGTRSARALRIIALVNSALFGVSDRIRSEQPGRMNSCDQDASKGMAQESIGCASMDPRHSGIHPDKIPRGRAASALDHHPFRPIAFGRVDHQLVDRRGER